MGLRALASFVTIVAGAGSALRRRLHRAPVEDGGRRLHRARGQQAQHLAQIVREGFKDPGSDPALGLIIDGMPGRQIVGDHPPRATRPHHVTQGVEHRPQGMISLRRVGLHGRQIRSAKRPFFISDIALVTALVSSFLLSHPKRDAHMYLHSTALFSRKCVTGSKLVIEYKFSAKGIPSSHHHSQANLYCYLLEGLGFDVRNLHYVLAIFPPDCEDIDTLRNATDFIVNRFPFQRTDISLSKGKARFNASPYDRSSSIKELTWASGF